MKRSVRWKFTIIFAGLMTVAIALIWCINNWFLSGYYQNYKIHTLEKGYRAIDAIIQDEVRNGESSLEDAQAELNSGWKEYQKSKDGSSDMDSADGGSAQSGKMELVIGLALRHRMRWGNMRKVTRWCWRMTRRMHRRMHWMGRKLRVAVSGWQM